MEVPSVFPSKTPDQISGASGFLALRDDLRLPGATTVQIGQQIVDRKRQTGRAAVDDAEVAGTVTDAGRGDAEQFAEGICWHNRIIRPDLRSGPPSQARTRLRRRSRSGSNTLFPLHAPFGRPRCVPCSPWPLDLC